MAHLLHKYHSSALFLGIGMLMLFSFCAPAFASDAPVNPTFRSTSPFGINQTIKEPATVNINGIHSGTIYKPFSSNHPYADLNPGSGSGGSGDPNDDIGIPGWADTPSEPLPIGDGMGILLLMATMMVGAIFLKQRKQLSESISKSTTSTTNFNNLRGNQLPTALKKENTTTHMTTRKQTYQSFFQKLFLLLVLVCIFAGQVSADKTIYYRPSTTNFANGYTDLKNKRADGGTGDGYQDVYWSKNGRLTASVHGNNKTTKFLDYSQTKNNTELIADPASRFIAITVPDGYTGVITYRLGSQTKKYYEETWLPNKPVGDISNTIPRWTNSATRIPEPPESIPTDGKNLLCNREGWWDVWYWAYYLPTSNTVTMYFANTSDWENVKLVTGKDIYTHETAPTTATIPNTKLTYFNLYGKEFGYEYYGFSGNGTTWDNNKTIPVVGGSQSGWVYDESSSFGNNKTTTAKNSNANQNRIANRIKYANNRTGLLGNLLKGTNLYIPGAQDAKPTHKTLTSWEKINHTQTITVKGGGKINYYTFKLRSANSTGNAVDDTNKTGTVTFDAAYTATVIIRAIPDNGYDFIGFFEEGSNTSLSYTEDSKKPGQYLLYYEAPNADKNITAVFSDSKAIRMQLLNDDLQWKNWTATPNGNTLSVAYTDIITNTANTYTFDKPRTENTWVYHNKEYIYINNIDASKNITFTADDSQSEYTFIGWWNNDIAYSTNPWSLDNPATYNQSVTARFARVKQQTVNVHTYNTTNDTYDALGTVGGNVSITYTKSAIDGVLKKDNDANGYSNGYKEFTNNVATSGTYASIYNSSVTLTATPNTNYAFLGWYEGENKVGSNTTYTYTATTERNITARFHKPFTQAFDVQTEIGGQYQNNTIGGSATITYNNTTTNLTDQVLSISNMEQGTMVTLNATSKSGYRFVGWYNGSGALDSSSPTYTYRAEGSRTVHARFAPSNITLSVAVLNYNPEYDKFEEYGYEYNTITLKENSRVLEESYSSFKHKFENATTVTLTATPEEGEDGYDFIGWYQNGTKISTEKTISINVIGMQAISAHFAPTKCWKLTLKGSVGGLYSVKYARETEFLNQEGMYYIAHSQYNRDVEIYVPYQAKIAIVNPQPIHGYEYVIDEKYKGCRIHNYTNNHPCDIINNDPRVYQILAGNSYFYANLARTEEQVVYLDISNKDKSHWKDVENGAFHCSPRTFFMTVIGTQQFEKVEGLDNIYKVTIPELFEGITIIKNGDAANHTTLPLAIPSTRYNCFKLNAYQSSTGEWVDAWTTLPTQTGDYRLIYREQTVVNKNEIHIDYEFNEGDRIKNINFTNPTADTQTDIVSLHIYNKVYKVSDDETINGVNNPEVILQQWNGIEWADVERYMVFGPLRSNNTGVIKMPNRKNTTGEKISVDQGIGKIIAAAATDDDKGCGVWNFVIQQTIDNGNVTAKLLVNETNRYEGDYYIRTTNADGQYNNYIHPGNVMKFSEYAAANSDYSHYFIRNVDINEDGTPTSQAGKHNQVKFTVATAYTEFLCKELMINNNRFSEDEYENDIFVINDNNNPKLPADASVRFGWDRVTNRLTRAYIANTTIKNNEYLVVEGTNIGSPQGDDTYFTDNSNWLYTIDLNAIADATAKVKAKMNGQYQYFMGAQYGSQNEFETLISGNGTNTYPIRLLYDFKDDRFTTIYRPDGQLEGTINVNTPLMIERVHNYEPTQIKLTTNEHTVTPTGSGEDQYTQPAYAVMTFLESVLADASKTHHEKMFYWISFPFDVRISDVFGLGDYGKYWIMEEYDGAQRAAQGLAQSNWKYITKKSAVLSKNVGYVLCLNYSQILQDQLFKSYGSQDENLTGGKLSLYFPSNGIVNPKSIVGGQDATIDLAGYYNANTAWNHHNWHIIGVPSFANPGTIDEQQDAPFVYQYWHPGDAYAAVSINDVKFQSMHAYMVQYAGEITWTNKIVNTGGNVSGGKSLAAKKDADADKKVMLRLELQQAGSTLDKTYVQLRNDKGTKGFDMSLDLTKIINAGANIYSIVDNHEMAGNAIPKDETVLPLGVVITAAGEYTFAMPNGTEGMIVELIDYEQGTSTNLLMSDYTITLDKGTFNQRFALRLVPDKVATSVDNIGNEADGDKVRKLLIDGVLYLQQGTNTYDAQGKHVQ